MSLAKIPEIGRFAVVGLINFGIDIAVFSIALYWLGFHLIVANTIAYSVATINSYLMNKFWTFAGRGSRTVSSEEFTRFLVFNVGGLALSNVTVFYLAEYVLPLVAKLGAVVVTFVWNYITIRRYVFRNTSVTTD